MQLFSSSDIKEIEYILKESTIIREKKGRDNASTKHLPSFFEKRDLSFRFLCLFLLLLLLLRRFFFFLFAESFDYFYGIPISRNYLPLITLAHFSSPTR